QERKLIKIISFNCRKDKREEVKMIITSKFYTLFDGEEFSKYFNVIEGTNGIEYSFPEKSGLSISKVRNRLFEKFNKI
ncbi:MAG: hypothetical protein WC679_12815, partial [Bacteroidales bacterium]